MHAGLMTERYMRMIRSGTGKDYDEDVRMMTKNCM
jgi:hypothetical protein